VMLGARCHLCVVLGIHHCSWALNAVRVWWYGASFAIHVFHRLCGGGAGRLLSFVCGAGCSSSFVGAATGPFTMLLLFQVDSGQTLSDFAACPGISGQTFQSNGLFQWTNSKPAASPLEMTGKY